MASGDDELARTATAPATPQAKALASVRLGRYELMRVLGEGGMGIVHAARDPDLDRGVALKLLRAAPSPEARARLLREARTMAKLSHANVITVYEVGSEGGEDYVAMELIDGSTLAEWMRERPTRRELLVAFVAAARGLAAAHAAGIVHRDFKPHNVLRRRDGRIVVTDFGIAHSAGTGELPHVDRIDDTATGTLVGTPAYMAPEQWRGEPVSAATDQFAFCVALWEALAGERPFRGASADELRAAVLAGPDQLDDAQIPRPLRALLHRGLALDPARRWPTMDAVIARLERVIHRRRRAIVASAIGLVAIGVTALLVTRSAAPSGCGQPAVDPEDVTARATKLGAKAVLADLARWRDRRAQACAAPAAVRSSRLACLDGVLARIDDIVRTPGPLDGNALALELVDPEVCDHSPPPHLASPIDHELAAAFAAVRAHKPLAATPEEPCARVMATVDKELADPTKDSPELQPAAAFAAETLLTTAGARCSDDAIKATAALTVALDDDGDVEAMHRAEAAVDAYGGEWARTMLDFIHGTVAASAKRFDEALALYNRALEAHVAHDRTRSAVDIVRKIADVRLKRGRADDLAAVRALVDQWRAAATGFPETAHDLARRATTARWRQGDVAGADADPAAGGDLQDHLPAELIAQMSSVDVTGVVVDEHGVPVPGAQVGAAMLLISDAARVAAPVPIFGMSMTITSDAHGRFAFHGARGFVAAASGDRRSAPMPVAHEVRLVLQPTARIAGRVALGDTPPGRIWILAHRIPSTKSFAAFVAPVQPDGVFVLDGVPRGKLEVVALPVDQLNPSAGDARTIDVDRPAITGVVLGFGTRAQLTVIARSVELTPPDGALVMVFRGHKPIKSHALSAVVKQFGMYLTMAQATGGVGVAGAVHSEPDDLIANIATPPAGDLTVCALGISKRQLAAVSSLDKFGDLMKDAEVGCTAASPTDTVVTVEMPPLRKLK